MKFNMHVDDLAMQLTANRRCEDRDTPKWLSSEDYEDNSSVLILQGQCYKRQVVVIRMHAKRWQTRVRVDTLVEVDKSSGRVHAVRGRRWCW